MSLEIERKWLVDWEVYHFQVLRDLKFFKHEYIRQVYLPSPGGQSLRIRTAFNKMATEEKGFVTIKARDTKTPYNNEWEMSIPFAVAHNFIEHAALPPLSKNRYTFSFSREINIEVDVFSKGLIIAEVEFPDLNYPFSAPEWFGDEITYDMGYSNHQLFLGGY